MLNIIDLDIDMARRQIREARAELETIPRSAVMAAEAHWEPGVWMEADPEHATDYVRALSLIQVLSTCIMAFGPEVLAGI